MCFHGRIDFSFPCTKIIEILTSTEKRMIIDKQFEQGTEILHIGDTFSIDHFIYKDQWPAAGRDFVIATYVSVYIKI